MQLPKNYYNFFDVCKMEGIPETIAKNACSDGIKGISRIEALKDIGHLFKHFEKPVRGGMRNQYGIKKSHYDYWKQTGEVPHVHKGKPKQGKKRLPVNISEDLINKFYAAIDKANSMSVVKVTYSDMVAVALEEFLQRRPQFLDDTDE